MAGKLSTALVAGFLTAALALSATNPARAQDKQAWEAKPMPKVGDIAPDFTLQYFDGNDEKKVSLSDYRGKKNVVLAFFIFAFTGG
jgi:cytochrome oxidase Cu insertion factor (SCO1/SenC/PrrC family)